MKRILLLTTASKTSDRQHVVEQFISGLNTAEDMYGFGTIQDVIFKIENGKPSVIIHGAELHQQYDVLHLRNHHGYTEFANALRQYCDAYGIHVVNHADACLPYFGKLSQGFLLAFNGVPTPDLISSYSNEMLLHALKEADWQVPFVVKHNDGMRGVDNYLVRSKEELAEILSGAVHGFVAQPFIENNGELRVLTFGEHMPPLVFRKTAIEGMYLNNTSQGGNAEMLAATDIPEGIMGHAKLAAKLTGREIAGVDVLLATNGSYVILEVNSTPSIASGVFLDEKLKIYHEYFSALEIGDV